MANYCRAVIKSPRGTAPPVPVHTAPPVPVHCATNAGALLHQCRYTAPPVPYTAPTVPIHCALVPIHCTTSAGTRATSASVLRYQFRHTAPPVPAHCAPSAGYSVPPVPVNSSNVGKIKFVIFIALWIPTLMDHSPNSDQWESEEKLVCSKADTKLLLLKCIYKMCEI